MIELPSFKLDDSGAPPEQAIRAYEADGVVCLRAAFSRAWVEAIRRGIDTAIADAHNKGGDSVVNVARPGEPGFFFYDMFLWRRYEVFRRYAFESPAALLAKSIMRSRGLVFYYDLVLVKEPGTSSKTPWHYDEAYWPVSGTQICNLWTALDHIPVDTALRFVRGSHRLRSNYRAMEFGPDIEYQGHPDPPPPDWDRDDTLDRHEIVYAELEPGDCLIINLRTHHSAPGNHLKSTRRRALATHWIGDDGRYNDKPWQMDPPARGENLKHGGPMDCASFPRVF